jgi:hypothetical protein
MVGTFSLIKDVDRGQPLLQPTKPRSRRRAYAHGTNMGKPFPQSLECNSHPTIYVLFQESTDDVSTNTNLYAGHGHGFYQNPSQQPNFSWQPGASQTPGPFFHGYSQQPRLPFLATLHFPDLTRFLNDPIYHDLHWPPMSTKLPLDIPKFKDKSDEDPGDHVTTFLFGLKVPLLIMIL